MNWTTIIGIMLWALVPGFIAKKKNRSFWGYYFLSLVISPLITIIITLCLKKKECNEASTVVESVVASNNVPVETSTKQLISTPIDDSTEKDIKMVSADVPQFVALTERKIQFCRRCGFKLADDGEYCSNCGNKIEKEDEI